MNRLSDQLKRTRIYQQDPMLQEILARYQTWTPEQWTPEQVSLDMGYLMGLIERLDAASQRPQ